jgi:hypothetical protein
MISGTWNNIYEEVSLGKFFQVENQIKVFVGLEWFPYYFQQVQVPGSPRFYRRSVFLPSGPGISDPKTKDSETLSSDGCSSL